MEPSSAISRAAMPEPHFVCGIQLRPFSIGAWLNMNRCALSFVGESNHGPGDLLLAIYICTRSYEDFAAVVSSGDLMRELSLLYHRMCGGFRGVWRRRFIRWLRRRATPAEALGFDFAKECKAFENYMAAHGSRGWHPQTHPGVRPITESKLEHDSTPIGAPEEMLLLNVLTTEQGITRSEALNMPLPLAFWERAVHAECRGHVQIITDELAAERRADRELANEIDRKIKSGELVLA